MERTLHDGTEIVLRPIAAGDKLALGQFLAGLSPTTVHQRFLGPKRRFTASELTYLTEVDGRDHVAVVAERTDAPGRLAAVGRWVRLAHEGATAEFAIVVSDEMQGLGLGSLVADELARRAKEEGVSRFTASTLSDNQAIVRLMARLATHLERHPDGLGVSEVAFDLAA